MGQLQEKYNVLIQQLQAQGFDRMLDAFSDGNDRLGQIFLTDITVRDQDPETGETRDRLMTTPEETQNYMEDFIGFPFKELLRGDAKFTPMRLFSMARGVSYEELIAFFERPDSPEAASAEAKMRSARQEYFDIVTSGDMDKIAGMYADIAAALKDIDISFLGEMTKVEGLGPNFMKLMVLRGGQSFVEQTLDQTADARERGFADPRPRIRAGMAARGQDFAQLHDGLITVDTLEATIRSAIVNMKDVTVGERSGERLARRIATFVPNLLVARNIADEVSKRGAEKFSDLRPYGEHVAFRQTAQMFSMIGSYGETENNTAVHESLRETEIDLLLNGTGLDFTKSTYRYSGDGRGTERDDVYYNEIADVAKEDLKAFRARIEQKAKTPVLFTKGEVARYLGYESGQISSDDRKILSEIERGDFSHFEKLSDLSRNMLASQYSMANGILFMAPFDAEAQVDRLETLGLQTRKNMLVDPVMRLAISLEMNSGATQEKREYCRQLDDALNRRIMQNTLRPMTQEEQIRLERAEPRGAEQMQARNAQSQKVMAKMLLMTHLGQMRVRDGELESPYQGSVAGAFAHCSRVMFSMPGGEKDQTALYGELLGTGYEDGNGVVEKRRAATHSLERSLLDDGLQTEEKKGICISNQYGMNVAVGGLGRVGIGGPDGERALLNDGSCGHVYMHVEKGDEQHYGGMLVGFESDAERTTNQLGHTHNIRAVGEKASSFGGQRTDEIGNKYGGRIADLRRLTPQQLKDVLAGLDRVMDDPSKSDVLLEKLTGDVMKPGELEDFLKTTLELDDDLVKGVCADMTVTELTVQDQINLQAIYDHTDEYVALKAQMAAENGEELPVPPANTDIEKERQETDDFIRRVQNRLDNMPAELPETQAIFALRNIMLAQQTDREQTQQFADKLRVAQEITGRLKSDDLPPQKLHNYCMAKVAAEEERFRKTGRDMEQTKKYLSALCGINVRHREWNVSDEMKDFIRDHQRDGVRPQEMLDEIALGKGSDVRVRDSLEDAHKTFEQLRARMDRNHRTFLGIKLDNSSAYQFILNSMKKIEELQEEKMTGDRDHDILLATDIGSAFTGLNMACRDYLQSHPNPRTQQGKERRAMVEELANIKGDLKADTLFWQIIDHGKIREEYIGKAWKEFDIGQTGRRKQMSFDDLLDEEQKEFHGKRLASRQTARTVRNPERETGHQGPRL